MVIALKSDIELYEKILRYEVGLIIFHKLLPHIPSFVLFRLFRHLCCFRYSVIFAVSVILPLIPAGRTGIREEPSSCSLDEGQKRRFSGSPGRTGKS